MNLKLEAARIANKHFSKGSKVKLGESEYISNLMFLDGAKGMLSDLLPKEISDKLSEKASYAEVDPSTIQVKETNHDIINKMSNFYLVMDLGKLMLVVVDKSGNHLAYHGNSIKSFKTVLYSINKSLGDEAALKQLGFK